MKLTILMIIISIMSFNIFARGRTARLPYYLKNYERGFILDHNLLMGKDYSTFNKEFSEITFSLNNKGMTQLFGPIFLDLFLEFNSSVITLKVIPSIENIDGEVISLEDCTTEVIVYNIEKINRVNFQTCNLYNILLDREILYLTIYTENTLGDDILIHHSPKPSKILLSIKR